MNRSLLAVVLVAFIALSAQAVLVFNETFWEPNTPPHWVIQGQKDAANQFSVGIPKPVVDFFGGGQGFLRLTTTNDGYQRASAFYTNDLVWSDDWRLEADIRIGAGADGMAFSCVGVGTNGVTFLSSPGELLGGYGAYVGAPRGPCLTNYGLGWHQNVGGYSVQFLTYSNDYITYNSRMAPTDFESSLCRNLRSWKPPVPNSTFNYLNVPGFFVTNVFVKTVLIQTTIGTTGMFALTWGPAYSTTNRWSVANYPLYPAYFGVSAGTGDEKAIHDVKNFKLEGTIVPEPAALLLLAGLAALLRRR